MAVGGIIGAIVGGIGEIHNVRSQQKAMRKAYIQQMSVLIKNYNYNQNALTTEERYSLESAKSNLFNIELNAIQNNAQVSVALSETGTEGRTSKQIGRAIEGQTERRKTSVIDNYYQDIGEIRQQKDALYIQVKDTVEQAKENFNAARASSFQNIMSVFQGSINGFMIGSGIGGGFSAMAGGGASSIAGAGSGSMSLAGIGSSGALSTGAAGASSAGSIALSAGSSGWSWGNFLSGFNQSFSKYDNMFQGMSMLSNMFGSFSNGSRNNRLYRYNFVY